MMLRDYLSLPIGKPITLEFEGFWYYTNGNQETLIKLNDQTKIDLSYLNDEIPLSYILKTQIKFRNNPFDFNVKNFDITYNKKPIYRERVEWVRNRINQNNVKVIFLRELDIKAYDEQGVHRFGKQNSRIFTINAGQSIEKNVILEKCYSNDHIGLSVFY